MKQMILTILFILLLILPAYAVPLNFYSGARPMGMGGVFTAVADDVNAIFYNPAGVVFVDEVADFPKIVM